jgi:hypothetical protein
MLSVIMPIVVMPSVNMLSVIMPSVIMPSVIMPSVIMPSVIMPSVVIPSVMASLEFHVSTVAMTLLEWSNNKIVIKKMFWRLNCDAMRHLAE